MPWLACGSQRKRSVPVLASFIFQVLVPTNETVVRRSKPGATTCASWKLERSRTTTVYVPSLSDLTALPAAVVKVIVYPGPDVRASFLVACGVGGVVDGEVP